jgi:hypothetical protein
MRRRAAWSAALGAVILLATLVNVLVTYPVMDRHGLTADTRLEVEAGTTTTGTLANPEVTP